MNNTHALRRYASDRDPQAFRQLVQSHHAMVVATCRRILLHEQDVEDAVQETFLKLARNAEKIRENPTAWLHGCATSTSVDLIRRETRRRARERTAAVPEVAGDGGGPVAQHELLELLDVCIGDLPLPERNAVIRHYLAGESQTEIAKEEGITQSGIRRRIDRAIDKLRIRLAARGLVVTVGAIATSLEDTRAGVLQISAPPPAHLFEPVTSPQTLSPPPSSRPRSGDFKRVAILLASVAAVLVGGWLAFGRKTAPLERAATEPPPNSQIPARSYGAGSGGSSHHGPRSPCDRSLSKPPQTRALQYAGDD